MKDILIPKVFKEDELKVIENALRVYREAVDVSNPEKKQLYALVEYCRSIFSDLLYCKDISEFIENLKFKDECEVRGDSFTHPCHTKNNPNSIYLEKYNNEVKGE